MQRTDPLGQPTGSVERPGRLGSRYVLERRLGTDPTGERFVGRDTTDGSAVAVRVLAPALAGDQRLVARLLLTGRRLRSVDHPNVARVREVVASGTECAVVAVLVPGGELLDDVPVPCDPRTAADLAAQVADGLGALHAAGVAHGDVRSATVLVERTAHGPVPKLVDAGLAGVLSGQPAAGPAAARAADLRGLGVLLHELVTGTEPAPSAVLPVTADLPAGLWLLLTDLLTEDALHRPDAASVAARLRRLAGDPDRSSRLHAVLPQPPAAPPVPAAPAPAGGPAPAADEVLGADDDQPTEVIPATPAPLAGLPTPPPPTAPLAVPSLPPAAVVPAFAPAAVSPAASAATPPEPAAEPARTPEPAGAAVPAQVPAQVPAPRPAAPLATDLDARSATRERPARRRATLAAMAAAGLLTAGVAVGGVHLLRGGSATTVVAGAPTSASSSSTAPGTSPSSTGGAAADLTPSAGPTGTWSTAAPTATTVTGAPVTVRSASATRATTRRPATTRTAATPTVRHTPPAKPTLALFGTNPGAGDLSDGVARLSLGNVAPGDGRIEWVGVWGGGQNKTVQVATGVPGPYQVTVDKLANGTPVTFTAEVCNQYQQCTDSDPLTVTPYGVPTLPAPAISASTTSITVTWPALALNGNPNPWTCTGRITGTLFDPQLPQAGSVPVGGMTTTWPGARLATYTASESCTDGIRTVSATSPATRHP